MDEWQAWIMEEQTRNSYIMALDTLIIAIVGILQIIKLYTFDVPTWTFGILGLIISCCLILIIWTTFFSKH